MYHYLVEGLRFPLEQFSFIKNSSKIYTFWDILKIEPTKRNEMFEPNLLSSFLINY